MPLGGMAIDSEYDPEYCGVHKIKNFDLEALFIFTFLTNNVFLLLKVQLLPPPLSFH